MFSLLLGILGAAVAFKKQWPLIVTGLGFLALTCGDFADWSPWHILHRLPVFQSHHVPSRFIHGFIFSIAIFAGFVLSKIESYGVNNPLIRKSRTIVVISSLFIISLELITVNSSVFFDAFPYTPPRINRNDVFQQTIGHHHNMYKGLLENRGTECCYDAVHFETRPLPIEYLHYKGEAYLIGRGNTRISYWSPNKITVNVAGEGIVCINQNYASGWQTKEGKPVQAFNGLISTFVTPEDRQVTFYYFPKSFLIGVIITVTSLIELFVLWRLLNRPRNT